MIVDVHVHHYPDAARLDPAGWAAAHGEPRWAAMVLPDARGRTVQGWASEDDLLREMDAAGVDVAVLQGWYWEGLAAARAQNRVLGALARRRPDRFRAAAAVRPTADGDGWAAYREALDAGCTAVGEACPEAQGFSWDDPHWDAILADCAAAGRPVTVHVSEPVGPAYPGRVATDFPGLVATAGRHPSLRLVLAHWGGGLPFLELNPAVRAALASAAYDTAASPRLYGPRVWETATGLAGAERVLFGSDFPLRLYRGASPGESWRRLLAEARGHLPPVARAAVLGANAATLFSIA